MSARRSIRERQALYATVVHERRLAAIAVILLFLVGSDVFQIVIGDEFPHGRMRFGLVVMMAVFVLIHLRFLLRGMFAVPELAALLGLAALSAMWSIHPSETVERTFQLLVTSSLVITLAAMLSLRSLVLSFGGLAALLMLGSMFAIVLLPEARGSETWPDAWRGIYNHKNGLGAGAAISLVVLSASAVLSRGALRGFFVFTIAVAFTLLVFSQSRTSQLVALLGMVAFFTAVASGNFTRVWGTALLALFGLFAAALYLAFASGAAEVLFEMLGRKPTLSGRLPLWELVWPEVEARIWTGYGYGAFWDGESPRVLNISRDPSLNFIPHYSHNGLLELLLHVGILGVPLFVITVGRAIGGFYVACNRTEGRVAAACALVLIVSFLGFNVTEGTILNRDSLIWLTFVAFAAKLALVFRRRSGRGAQSAAGRTSLPHNRRYPARTVGVQ